jgi:hypothetical protein
MLHPRAFDIAEIASCNPQERILRLEDRNTASPHIHFEKIHSKSERTGNELRTHVLPSLDTRALFIVPQKTLVRQEQRHGSFNLGLMSSVPSLTTTSIVHRCEVRRSRLCKWGWRRETLVELPHQSQALNHHVEWTSLSHHMT